MLLNEESTYLLQLIEESSTLGANNTTRREGALHEDRGVGVDGELGWTETEVVLLIM
jgi:hypothetical protein